MNNAIVARSLAKQFPIGENRMTAFRRTAKLLRGIYRRPQQVNVLRDVNLDIPRGSKIALLGHNGSGKSTLLRTIAGIYAPSSGAVAFEGSLTILSGWGVGQVEKLTVKQNVYLLGTIYGLYRDEIDRHYEDILSWAELEKFESNQLFTLSTGMRTRLAFSTTRHVNSDIFLLDEAFSAGDRSFRDKCNNYFKQPSHRNRTYVIATHNPEALTFFCNQAMWLDEGRIAAFGPIDEVIEAYEASKRS